MNYAGGRVVLALEGGYDLRTISDSAEECVKVALHSYLFFGCSALKCCHSLEFMSNHLTNFGNVQKNCLISGILTSRLKYLTL